MYHSVAPGERTGPETFEDHLQALARSGLPSLRAADLDTAPRGFLVTFDDGFSDLWTHGLPLLKAYNIRAVVFAVVSTAGEGEPRAVGERVYPGPSTQALGETARQPGPHPAFLRWSELQALEKSGLVEVQSHTFEHRMGWKGSQIRGFHLGRRGRGHWTLPQATGGDERLGIPLYPRGSGLGNRLYLDDAGLRECLAQWLAARGGEGYIGERGVETVTAELSGVAESYRSDHGDQGRWETDEEREARTLRDLSLAKEGLESRLGGCRDELCLPWGHYDDVTMECARRVGIRRLYTVSRGPNPAQRIGFLVHRFGPMRESDGASWLRKRLWVYRSSLRASLYGQNYGVRLPGLLATLWKKTPFRRR
jgi:peptidoglycan/xylan/chitin deacetylase (PgdA/CDA1 family)